MCGICGILHTEQNKAVDREVLLAMAESLKHRGPDDEAAL